ncbi:MAG: metallopeptidase TldD-related protein [Elusimicrobiales bacterium]|nr:metallopeptidase TldD-related protein [Elusimicrobiales bacterium]
MRRLVSLAVLAAFCAPAAALDLPGDDSCLLAMRDELSRNRAGLRMENFPAPYFLSYDARSVRLLEITASLGAVIKNQSGCGLEMSGGLRVGSPAFDNSNFYGAVGGKPETEVGAQDCAYDNIRHNLWQLTDRAYKAAVEKLDQKRAFREKRSITSHLGDFSRAEPAVLLSTAPPQFPDRAAAAELAGRVSAVFGHYPLIEDSLVTMQFEYGLRRYLNSEGALYRGGGFSAVVSMAAGTQAPDGYKITQGRDFYYASTAALPGEAFFAAEAEKFAAEMSALAKSEIISPYIGPVLIEREAAGAFFYTLLARHLLRPRMWWNERGLDPHTGYFYGKLGMRVAAPFISVVDDPSLEQYAGADLAGHYEVDDEGVRARRVELVRKGKLVDLLMSRAPVKERAQSNGHGRGYYVFPEGTPGNLLVSASNALPEAQLKRKLLAMCGELELDYGIILRNVPDFYGTFTAWKVYVKDGREEPVHGAQFAEFTLRALRDIAFAGDKAHVYNYDFNAAAFSIAAPAVILQEAELKKTESQPDKLPYLANPYFEKAVR